MNIMSMESIFLLLSGVILFAGIIYWMWSHIQLTQKKVQLLENAVFELRGMMTPGAPPGPVASSPSPSPSPSPAYEDLPDDGWEEDQENMDMNDVRSTPLENIGGDDRTLFVEREDHGTQGLNEDLMPGAPALNVTETEDAPAEDFRELFVSQESATPVRTPESLESMPVKELRRLAEQRGIAGAADMRKKEILSALRKQVSPAGEVTVQKTLDLNIEEVSEPAGEEILE